MLLTLSNCYFSPLAEYPFQSLGEGNKKKEKPLFPPFPNPSGGSLRILFSRNRLLPLGGCLHRLPPCTPLCKPCCSIILEGLSLKFSLTGRLATQTRFLKTSKTWWKNRHPLLPFQQVLGRENSQQFGLVIIYSTQLRNLLENVSRVAKRRNETLVWNYYFFFVTVFISCLKRQWLKIQLHWGPVGEGAGMKTSLSPAAQRLVEAVCLLNLIQWRVDE